MFAATVRGLKRLKKQAPIYPGESNAQTIKGYSKHNGWKSTEQV